MADTLPRYGLLAGDPMRIAGLRTILGDGLDCHLALLTGPRDPHANLLTLAIIDLYPLSGLFQLLADFRLFAPRVRLLVIGEELGHTHIARVIASGAKGYLHQSASEDELRNAIQVVCDQSVWAPRKVLAYLLERKLQHGSSAPAPLRFTPRELDVLRLLVLGHPNRQIASSLGVDEATIKAHMGRLMRKAGVDNRTALSMRAIEGNWTAGSE